MTYLDFESSYYQSAFKKLTEWQKEHEINQEAYSSYCTAINDMKAVVDSLLLNADTEPEEMEIVTEETADILAEIRQGYTPDEAGYTALTEAINILRHESKAQEYRTPKKIRVRDDGWGECPSCHYSFYANGAYKYCYRCGQALFWTEGDE